MIAGAAIRAAGSAGRQSRGRAPQSGWMLVACLLWITAVAGSARAQEQEHWLAAATALQQQAVAAQSAGRSAEAALRLTEALEILKLAYGPSHPVLAPYLIDLATVEESRQGYARALALRREALGLLEQRLGPRSPELQPNLLQLTWLHVGQGQWTAAEVYLQRALTCERPEGAPPADGLSALRHFARRYRQEGARDRAESLLQRAVFLLDKMQPPDPVALASTLGELADLAGERGEYARAEALLQRALTLVEHGPAARPLATAALLARLARLALTQAEYGRAELLALRAQAEFARQQEPREERQVMVLLDLGAIFAGLGSLDQALLSYTQALELQRALPARNQADVATTLLALAGIHLDREQQDAAARLTREAIVIRERVLGPHHPELATALIALADIEAARGQRPRAAELIRRALAIQEALPGKVRTAELLLVAARFYQETGALGEAEALIQRALSAALLSTGPRSALSAAVTFALAELRRAQAQLDRALPLYWRAFDLYEARLRQLPTESMVLTQLRRERSLEESIYSLLLSVEADEAVRRLALAVALLRKGRAVDEGANTGQAILQSLNSPEQRRELAELQRLRREQVSLIWQATQGLPAEQQRLVQTQAQIEALERKLAAVSQPLRTLRFPESREIIPAVARAMPADGALIEVVVARKRQPRMTPQASDPRHFIALILTANEKIDAVDLGDTGPIEQEAHRWLALLRSPRRDPRLAGLALYRQLVAPLLSRLAGKQRLYVSAEGVLNLIPWGALQTGQESLLERFQITYLTSGRDLLRQSSVKAPSAALVIADPDFRYDAEAGALVPARPGSVLSPGLYAQLESVPALPGTRKEAERLRKLLPEATILLGRTATRRALLAATSPRVLHIATHGIFLDAAPVSMRRAESGRARNLMTPRSFTALEPELIAEPAEAQVDNPLVRSALLLSGAAARSGARLALQGVVTAKEVAGMDLWGTQLVVLSACDTGRGALEVGQGVYGLRRAFLVAGAESLVSSLWQVADAETADLMAQYYQNLLAGQGRAEAMRTAALWMKRRRGHPYYWAAFLVIGKEAPLTGIGIRAEPRSTLVGRAEKPLGQKRNR